ncbi:hypothetical protein H5T87_06905 [bacterium]|nr:hypothetical protein [bacterium]
MRGNRGQALIIAIGILFVISMFAAIYIGIINRLFTRTRYEESSAKASALAQAGIEYANQMLTQSEEGASWRPLFAPPYPFDPNDPRYPIYQQYDPDFDYLKLGGPDGKGAFVRFNMGDGRFLLRVTYNYRPDDPLSSFIKIESIGKPGNASEIKWEDPNFDPTTIDPALYTPYKRTLVAYKPIYITDFALFVTNNSRREEYIRLGAPNWVMFLEGGLRVNGNLRWFPVFDPQTGQVLPHSIALLQNKWDNLVHQLERVEVAGEIIHQESPNETPAELQVQVGNQAPQLALPSSDPNFTTFRGYYRDGVFDRPDVNGFPRSITYAEAPRIDRQRYVSLARDSGGIYINNFSDIQYRHNIENLRLDWLRRQVTPTSWSGSVYVPPGVEIFLEPRPYPNDPNILTTSITIVRHDRAFPDGTYTRIYWLRDVKPIIYAEGNIRIKGRLAPNEALTVVSNGTIYIEGMLGTPWDERPNDLSAIALLAADAICLNTTQVPTGLPSITTTASIESDNLNGQPPFHWHLHEGEYFVASFYSGRYTSYNPPTTTGFSPNDIKLRITTATGGIPGFCLVDMWAYNVQTRSWQFVGNFLPRTVAPNYELVSLPNLNWFTPPTLPNAIGGIWLQPNPTSTYDAWIGGIWVEPLTVNISALLYAQNGPFFVIPPPGEWKLELGEPLNWRVEINGAVVENWPVGTYDVMEWTSKLSPGIVVIRWDPALVINSPRQGEANLPNLPYLPTSPSYFYEGEVPR